MSERLPLSDPDENILIEAEPGSLGDRLVRLWQHHTEDAQCWCEPTVHTDGAGTTLIEHYIVAEQRAGGHG
jgi:hypothetical protein